jgi:hypothetical protein
MLKKLLKRKSKDDKREPRDPNAPNSESSLDQAKFGFNLLANLGEGAFNIPGLKAAAKVAVQIIEVMQVRRGSELV